MNDKLFDIWNDYISFKKTKNIPEEITLQEYLLLRNQVLKEDKTWQIEQEVYK